MRSLKSRDYEKWKRLGTFLMLLLVFGVLSNSVRKVYGKKEGAEKALARMDEEVQELALRKVFLETSIARLGTTEGMKFEIKKKLNVAEAGESVAIIVVDEVPAASEISEVSFWQKIKNLFE